MDEAKQSAGKNRRVFARRVPKRKARIFCYKGTLDLGPNLAVSLLDVSESGIRLVVKELLEMGQEVNLALEGTGHRRPLKSNGKVMWCVPTQDNQFCIGIKLEKYLPYQEIARLT